MTLALLAAGLLGPVPAASAQPKTIRVEDPEERLDRWFDLQRRDITATRWLAGPASLVAGTAMVGAGIAGLAGDIHGTDPNLAWLQLGVGGLGLAQGVVWLLISPDAEGRWQRWRAAREAGLDDEERARFEGELRAYPFIAQAQRALYRWSGLGLVFGGAVTLGALAAADGIPRGHAITGWTTAGVYTGVGVALLVSSFLPSFGEHGWEAYRDGRGPRRIARCQARVAPWAHRAGAGLSVAGRF